MKRKIFALLPLALAAFCLTATPALAGNDPCRKAARDLRKNEKKLAQAEKRIGKTEAQKEKAESKFADKSARKLATNIKTRTKNYEANSECFEPGFEFTDGSVPQSTTDDSKACKKATQFQRNKAAQWETINQNSFSPKNFERRIERLNTLIEGLTSQIDEGRTYIEQNCIE